jgi:hypothetical protein
MKRENMRMISIKKMLDNKKEKDWIYLLVFSIQKVRFNKIFN